MAFSSGLARGRPDVGLKAVAWEVENFLYGSRNALKTFTRADLGEVQCPLYCKNNVALLHSTADR
jgi:hypothetical protein